jgi:hypothetical protein
MYASNLSLRSKTEKKRLAKRSVHVCVKHGQEQCSNALFFRKKFKLDIAEWALS